MRCNIICLLLAGVVLVPPNASAQNGRPAPGQLMAPGAANVNLQTVTPPGSAPAVAGSAAASAALSAGAAPVSAPNVVTLGQAANSAPAPVISPSLNASMPPIVPAIQGNTVLATGNNSKLLDSAGPRSPESSERRVKPYEEIALIRISYSDDETRALLRVHGVVRYVDIGSKVKKFTVRSISEDGVCLVTPVGSQVSKQKKSPGSGCAKLVSFE